MNFIRNIFFIVLTAFIFVGSVGVGVYSHFCEKDGVEQSYFVKQAHHCDKEVEIEKPSCCAHKTSEIDNDCCSDQIQLMQIDLDYFQQVSIIAFVPFVIPTPVYSVLLKKPITNQIANANFANPPPKLSGRDIIIQHQVFLI